ncbi:exodeoxyribonuclease VII small subunit [Streptomyces inhibens]|uniref:Exodeoxyribonuclease 7 small subunit n=1 Tax=Streptomyces inhibens TaxID=2293571 RepID=A0A371Q197_STRIH|nr:exodeoxyribonuclease VII small subunit [Streptomyces inhibens]REK88475.1 exodeoxyribonuclease VII small subunit [Streptomyces inhibens]UKY52466.1 exodeoxyribonuclease VII small subunit [Streptomyces inhibens]
MAKAKTDGAADAEQQGAAAGAEPRADAVASVDSTLGYEQARDELIEVVRSLEAGGTTLEESLALWERGEALAKVCRRWLDGARARLDAALAESSGGADAGAERA